MLLKSTSSKVLPAPGTVFFNTNFFLPPTLYTPAISYTGGIGLPSLSNTGFPFLSKVSP